MKQKILTFSPLTEKEIQKQIQKNQLKALMGEVISRNETLEQENRKFQQQLSALKSENNALQQKNSVLESEKEQAVSRNNILEAENKELREQNKTLDAQKTASVRKAVRFCVFGVVIICCLTIIAVITNPIKYTVVDNTEESTVPAVTESAVPEELITAQTGELVLFGDYEWYAIDKSSDGCTLLCKEIVREKAYHDEGNAITWEECTLRKWLNDEFYHDFNEEEKALIDKTRCINQVNSKYDTSGGYDTKDYIYLLSIEEAKSLDKTILNASESWWLRSVGDISQFYAAEVYCEGEGYISSVGKKVDSELGVRPALTLKF